MRHRTGYNKLLLTTINPDSNNNVPLPFILKLQQKKNLRVIFFNILMLHECKLLTISKEYTSLMKNASFVLSEMECLKIGRVH